MKIIIAGVGKVGSSLAGQLSDEGHELILIDKNEKVIYMSTFTKSLMPSLRVAYFVLPSTLLKAYKQKNLRS